MLRLPAFAQSTAPQADPKNQGAGAHPATTGTTSAAPSGQTDASGKSVGAHPATTGTATSIDSWATKYATDHHGRVSRQAYLDEMGRRFDTMDKAQRGDLTRQGFLDDLGRQWEAMDRGNQGLPPADVGRIQGKVPGSADGQAGATTNKAAAPK